MKLIACACLALILSTVAEAQVPITQLVAAVASKTGKKFVLDPHVQGDAMIIGQNPSEMTLADLTNVLQLYGFTVLETAGYVRIVPDTMARTLPVPTVTGNERYPDGAMVSRIIKVKSISAAQLIPILRPIVPQSGHLVAYPCTNTLMIVDSYANTRRLEALVQTLDKGPTSFESGPCIQPTETEKR